MCIIEQATYLLVGEDITSYISLFALDELDVCLHSLLGECSGKLVVDVGVRVKTGKLLH